MHIREINPPDERLARRFWELGRAADEKHRPWSPYWSWPAARAAYTEPSTTSTKLLLGAFEGEAMLGGAELSLPLLEKHPLRPAASVSRVGSASAPVW